MDDQEGLLKEVFGESSDSEDYEQPNASQLEGDALHPDRTQPTAVRQNPIWEQITDVRGLWVCRDFLSAQLQSSLLSAIENEGWFTEASHNQAMRFGNLPIWAIETADSIRELVLSSDHAFDPMVLGTYHGDQEAFPFPSDLLWREPLFDQLIVNVYQPGDQCTC